MLAFLLPLCGLPFFKGKVMTRGSASNSWVAYTSLVLAALIWSSSFIGLKIAFEAYPPMFVIFARMLIASVVFLMVWKYLKATRYRAGDWKLMAVMVISEPCLYFVFEAYALQNTSASQAGMITSILPLMVAIASMVFFHERLSRRAWLGFFVAVCGGIWLSMSAKVNEHSPNPMLGNFLELCAMICATAYILSLKRLSERYSSWVLTAVQSFAGAIFFLPLALIEPFDQAWEVNTRSIAAIVYLGVLVNIGAYGLYNLGVSKVSASQAGLFLNLMPVFTAIIAFLVLGEQLLPVQILASALVLLGVVLGQWQRKKR